MSRKRGKRRQAALGMIAAAAGLLLYCGSFYVKSYLENRQVQNSYDSLRELCLEGNDFSALDEKDRDDKGNKCNKTVLRKQNDDQKQNEDQKRDVSAVIDESFGIQWKSLRQVNAQAVAWITVPGADISYPVVQGEDDEYYLHHSITGEENPFGTIFLGCQSGADFLDSHSFLYGHNMEGKMMFANLNCYEEQAFLEKCPQFFITTPEKKFCYDIFSVEQADEQSPAFRYGYPLESPEYKKQLQQIKDNSMYSTDIMPDEKRQMVTLVTCNSSLDEHVRMAVHGICHSIQNWEENS